MTITIDDVFKELRPRIKSAFNGVSVSKQDNHILISSKDASSKEVTTKINFHPEIKKDENAPEPKTVDGVTTYPRGHFAIDAYVSVDIGVAQISGSIIPTRFHIKKDTDGTLNAEWNSIVQGAIRNLKRKIKAPTTP